MSLEFTRKAGENDQLFGSVTSLDVAEALAGKGFEMDRKKIVLAEPIKVMGEYEVPVKLHREVIVQCEGRGEEGRVGRQYLWTDRFRWRRGLRSCKIVGRLEIRDAAFLRRGFSTFPRSCTGWYG